MDTQDDWTVLSLVVPRSFVLRWSFRKVIDLYQSTTRTRIDCGGRSTTIQSKEYSLYSSPSTRSDDPAGTVRHYLLLCHTHTDRGWVGKLTPSHNDFLCYLEATFWILCRCGGEYKVYRWDHDHLQRWSELYGCFSDATNDCCCKILPNIYEKRKSRYSPWRRFLWSFDQNRHCCIRWYDRDSKKSIHGKRKVITQILWCLWSKTLESRKR